MALVPENDEQLRAAVRARYAGTALQVLKTSTEGATACCDTDCCTASEVVESEQAKAVESSSSCCDTSCCTPQGKGDPITADLYSQLELGDVPMAAALASLGCGNPTALAELRAGERVLDLGSGGGIDVLLSARRVGPSGFVYGLDMTDPMLELAERNRREAGVENVQFLKGLIEAIPLPDESVDVVISNCVINLSADKGQVLREAYRVLAPGGRFAVSDIVIQGHLPQAVRQDMEAWAGCMAGALEEEVYRQLLAEAGFGEIDVEVTRRYGVEDLQGSVASRSLEKLPLDEQDRLAGAFVSAFVRARKLVG